MLCLSGLMFLINTLLLLHPVISISVLLLIYNLSSFHLNLLI